MSEMKENENKKMKCNFKCRTCENYIVETDYCKEKEIEDCSRHVNTDFSVCEDYLIRENLIMF